jgi:1-acyl-sn-glycerol-3-phosphate acyltransferase
LSFASFGIGGIVMAGLVFPALALIVRDPDRRERASREALRRSFVFFVGFMRAVGVLRYEVRGTEALRRGGMLIVANHPTLIDAVFLMSLVRNATCVADHELASNPFTRSAVRAGGFLRNDGGIEVLHAGLAALARGTNLIVFPEGSRTPLDGSVRMLRGAANLAVRGGHDITPVVIRCEPRTLTKGSKWWQVPARRANFRIEVGGDITVRAFVERAAGPALAARHLTAHLERYFSEETNTRAVA